MKRFIPLVLVLLPTACGESYSSSSSLVEIDNAPGIEIGFNGVTLVCDETIQYRSKTTSISTEGSTTEVTVNGMPFELVEGMMRIGEESFAGLEAGDRVELGASGIRVNGELRWPMPTQ